MFFFYFWYTNGTKIWQKTSKNAPIPKKWRLFWIMFRKSLVVSKKNSNFVGEDKNDKIRMLLHAL